MSEHIATPEGYMMDAMGRLVPERNIKEIDKMRHALVLEKVAQAKALQKRMRDFKLELFADVEAFIALSLERYGVKTGGKKGNATLVSFDGRYELRRQVSEHFTFDEGLQAAKALIDECLRGWTKDSPGDLRAIVDHAFRVDKEGRLNIGAILGLRRVKITDERWLLAMEAIGDALQIRGSKGYIRLYAQDEHGNMNAISLDFAAL